MINHHMARGLKSPRVDDDQGPDGSSLSLTPWLHLHFLHLASKSNKLCVCVCT